MNKYEKAYDEIELASLCIDTKEEAESYLPIIKELVELTVPIKPIAYCTSFLDGHLVYFCPKCGCKLIGQNVSKFCHNCGKAIDWNMNI